MWGRDKAEIEGALAAAVKAGTLSTGDQIVKALWLADHGTPANRARASA